jgi:hypothetical protein
VLKVVLNTNNPAFSMQQIFTFHQDTYIVGRIKADDEFPDTVKPVLRGHLWGKEKVAL